MQLWLINKEYRVAKLLLPKVYVEKYIDNLLLPRGEDIEFKLARVVWLFKI